MCFFLLKCWICWICWIILCLWEAKRDQLRGKIIQHIQHIQHFRRKKHTFFFFFFEKCIQHDLTYSTFQQKEAFFRQMHSTWYKIVNIAAERSTPFEKRACFREIIQHGPKVVLSAEIIQHGPKSGLSAEKTTWPQKYFFQQKSCFQVLFCCLFFSVSLSLFFTLFCTSPLVSLSFCLSPFLSLFLATPPLCPRPSSVTLSFSLTFSVLGSDLDWGLGLALNLN